ncbi:hypothetical protein SDC9_69824 [bioreactor metagenome]|uniref:DNA-directed DNA polymerase n=1 Tax=bioreactor metagenome TaxID=1076179 RepID=A0A644Y9V4_9ZZZZ
MWKNRIVGQEYAVELFEHVFQNDKLAQSYLFYGPEGVGKRTFATSLAKAIFCKNGYGVGCGSCPACLKVEHQAHADFLMIQPLEGKQSISIDQVRQLPSILYRKPQEGQKRIVVIDSLDDMEVIAQNALLKLLEEPPQDNVLILLARQIQQILPTIQSRCQPVRFRPLTTKEVATVLSRQFPEKKYPEAAFVLARGSVSEALNIADNQQLMTLYLEAIEWFFQEEDWKDRDRTEWISQQEKANWSRDEFILFWEIWQGLYRDRLIIAAGGQGGLLQHQNLEDRYRTMKMLSASEMIRRLYEIDQGLLRLKKRGNGPMVTEAILMKWRRE